MSTLQVLLFTLAVTLCNCEPPVPYNYQAPSNNYLPPSTSYGTPSSNYAAPSTNYQSNQYIPPVSNHGYQAQNQGYQAQNQGYQAHNHGHQAQSQGYDQGHGYDQGQGYGGDQGYSGGHDHGHGHGHDNEVPKSYEFGYAVKDAQSGNDYDRHETSDGNTVRGEYRVQLPDGRTQIVTYHADWKTGFHADVRYEGEAVYPEPTYNHNAQQQQGYNYNTPSDYSGSLTGLQGHQGHSAPSNSYGAPSSSYGAPSSNYGAPY